MGHEEARPYVARKEPGCDSCRKEPGCDSGREAPSPASAWNGPEPPKPGKSDALQPYYHLI